MVCIATLIQEKVKLLPKSLSAVPTPNFTCYKLYVEIRSLGIRQLAVITCIKNFILHGIRTILIVRTVHIRTVEGQQQ